MGKLRQVSFLSQVGAPPHLHLEVMIFHHMNFPTFELDHQGHFLVRTGQMYDISTYTTNHHRRILERDLQLYLLACLSLHGMALNTNGIIVVLIVGAMLTIGKKA